MNLRIVGEYDLLENSEYEDTELSLEAERAARPPTLQDPNEHMTRSGLIFICSASGLALFGLADVVYRIVQWFHR